MITGSTRRSNSNKWREAHSNDPARLQLCEGLAEHSTSEPATRANLLEAKKLPVPVQPRKPSNSD